MTPAPLPRRLRLRIQASRFIAWWERAVPALWPALLTAGLFLAASLFGVWTMLPGWLHLLLLAGFAVALLRGLRAAAAGLRPPSRGDGIRRLERTGGVPHRPVSAILDRPAALVDAARGAWRAHRERMLREASRLRLALPRNAFAAADPLALRALLLILLVAGFGAFGTETPARMRTALDPDFAGERLPGTLTAWVDPPAYMRQPAIPLEPGAPEAAIPVPDGSVLVARVHGGAGEADAEIGGERAAFIRLDEDNASLEAPIRAGGPVAVRQGSLELARWVFDVVPDSPPEAAFAEPPSGTARGALRLDVEARDDHGIRSLEAVIRWRGGPGEDGGLEPIRISLPVPSRTSRRIDSVTYHDLAPHPWAGEPATLTLLAEDERGQSGESAAAEAVLPARRFLHPVAAAVVGERKRLALRRAPDPEIGAALSRLAEDGGRYGNDRRVRSALEESAAALGDGISEDARAAMLLLLWRTALRVEEGNLAEAEEALRSAQDELADAFREGLRPEDLEEMLAGLDEKLERYLDEMERAEGDEPEGGEEAASEEGGQDAMRNATRRELEDLVDDIVDMATTGAPEKADEDLRRMREITENMDRAGERMLAESDQARDQRQAMMQQIRELMQEQEQLMEESFYQSARAGLADANSPGSGQFNPPDSRQESLRRELGELMRELGETGEEIPQELGEAGQAMRQAARELQRQRPGLASESQGQALDLLRLGGENLREMPGGLGPSQAAGEQPGRHNRRSRDPFGRVPPGEGSSLTGEVEIPAEPEVRRAREILEELRRRADDEARPELDRDYAERLLDWY